MLSSKETPFKIVLVGDGASGKSCIIQSYLSDSFRTDYIPTVFDNYKANINVESQSTLHPENQTYQITIWYR